MGRSGQGSNQQDRRRLVVAILASLGLHIFLVIAGLPDRSSALERLGDVQVVELVSPQQEEPAPETPPTQATTTPAAQRASTITPQKRPTPPRPPAPRRPRPARPLEDALPPSVAVAAAPLAELPRPTTIEPTAELRPQPDSAPEAPDDESIDGEGAPEEPEAVQLITPQEALRREGLRPLAGLDEGAQDQRRVTARVDAMARAALPPRLDDPPGFPELLPDDEGNMTWHFYYLVAKIRPDGSVLFVHDSNYRSRGRKTGRYCHEIALGLGRCREQATVPWPEEWGQQLGSFPEGPIKRWFLRQTEELRARMAELERTQRLVEAPSRSRAAAQQILSDLTLGSADRRRLLFELWDECEEPPEAGEAPSEVESGLLARRSILELIGRELPEGSIQAYTAEELRLLNQRRMSREEFHPYRSSARRSALQLQESRRSAPDGGTGIP
jgi:hypothetical protein